MSLKPFQLSRNETRLVKYQDTVYKVKINGRDVGTDKSEHSNSNINCEIESVLRAVLHIEQSNGTFPEIKTEHFVISVRKSYWKAIEKLGFKKHNMCLKAHPFLIILDIRLEDKGRKNVSHGVQSCVDKSELISGKSAGSTQRGHAQRNEGIYTDKCCVMLERLPDHMTADPCYSLSSSGTSSCDISTSRNPPTRNHKKKSCGNTSNVVPVKNTKGKHLSDGGLAQIASSTGARQCNAHTEKKKLDHCLLENHGVGENSTTGDNSVQQDKMTHSLKKLKTRNEQGFIKRRASPRQIQNLYQSNNIINLRQSPRLQLKFSEEPKKSYKDTKMKTLDSKSRRKHKLYTQSLTPLKKIPSPGEKQTEASVSVKSQLPAEPQTDITHSTLLSSSQTVDIGHITRNKDEKNTYSESTRLNNMKLRSQFVQREKKTADFGQKDRYSIQLNELEEDRKLERLAKPISPSVPVTRKRSGIWDFIDILTTPIKKMIGGQTPQ